MAVEKIGLTLSVHPNNPGEAAQAVETLSRMAAGFALEGIWCELTLTPFELITEEIESGTEES
jgi:hypothetical protein